jgi:hypothetical protein
MRLLASLLSSTTISMRYSLIIFLMMAVITFFMFSDSCSEEISPFSKLTASR